tara:strand:- start:3197 stop:4447 length:1251 start_codon:yes stop_codon:yes gene_type:complete
MFRSYLHGFGIQLPSFSPDDDLSIGASPDDADVLDDNTEEEKEEKPEEEPEDDPEEEDEPKDDEEEEKDEEEKDEEPEEEEEPEDEKLEVPPSVKEIKAKYPTFFKEFPEVRAAIFREQRFTELFASPDEAENSVKKASLLDEIEADLLDKADPTNLFDGIKKSNAKSFEKLALALLPTIQQQDKDLYTRVAATPIKQLLRSALKEGRGTDGKLTDLGKSALWIHQYFFGKDAKPEDPVEGEVKPSTEKSESEKRLEAKLEQINQREYTEFKGSVDTSYVTKMTSEFKATLDKDERLTDFVKRTIIKDGLVEIRQALEKDPRYTRQMSALWNQAVKAGYSSDLKSRIVSTALARAKSLVPSIRQKLVSEALGTKSKAEKKEVKVEKREERKVVKRSNSGNNSRPSKPLSDMDILRG